MQRPEPENNSSLRLARKDCLLSGVLMAFWMIGCGSGTNSSTPATTQQAPQTYFAPYVRGITVSASPQTFIFDEGAMPMMFSQETFFNLPGQVGPTVINAGSFTASQRGLLSLEISTSGGVNYDPAQTGSFAVELPGQAGGLVQLVGQPVEPLVAATQCPNFTSAQTYQFVTIPAVKDLTLTPTLPGGPPGTPTLEQNGSTWNPTTDTAYGSADIMSSGSSAKFQNIHQYILPSEVAAGGTGAPAQPSSSLVPAPCGSTTLGDIISVPSQYVVINPGATSTQAPPQAAIGIGPTGLLVEDNGSSASGLMANTSPGIHYENVLGAGTGAVGLPKPSSALDTGAVVGQQYLGFIYAAGASNPAVTWTSHLASFGFSSVPSSCPPFPGGSSTRIYGGDYPQTNGQDDPSASPDSFGKCDFAIDLGTQSDNGLYPNATVWVGSGYAGYAAGGSYESFQAVAIAGQLNAAGQTNGKYAIFLLGIDSTQPWAIYLLQSN